MEMFSMGKLDGKIAKPLWRKVLGNLYRWCSGVYHRTIKPIKLLICFFRNSFSITGNVSSFDRRVLAILDLRRQPFSVGDTIVFLEGAEVVRELNGLNSIDVAVVFDPQKPTLGFPFDKIINPDNALFHIASLLPVAQVNPNLASLFVFNSHAHLLQFVVENEGRYNVWPSPHEYATGEYLHYTIMNELVHKRFVATGTIPHLTCRPFLSKWAKSFYRKNVLPRIPVTVNIRNNPVFDQHRNSKMECWKALFDFCKDRHPVTFVIICAFSEIDTSLRGYANVVIAKDHYTGVEQDLALMSKSAMHMGVASGPCAITMFNENPYCLLGNYESQLTKDYQGIIQEDPFFRYSFSTPLQRIFPHPETTDILCSEFIRLWQSIDQDGYLRSLEDAQGDQKENVGACLR
jgi:hypothetical protein